MTDLVRRILEQTLTEENLNEILPTMSGDFKSLKLR